MRTIKGHTVSFRLDLENGLPVADSVPAGAIVIDDDGRIGWAGPATELPQRYRHAPVTDYGDKLVIPGFVDAHLHYPQYRMLASYGRDLLEWLNRYTFVEEQRFDERAVADAAAAFFCDRLIANGTTSCLAFSTIHETALTALFGAAQKRHMAVTSGLCLMDRNAPPGLLNNTDNLAMIVDRQISQWHAIDRLAYAISPRFAITSTEAQLEICGELVRRYPQLLIQTHLSENHAEIALTRELFPDAKDYTDVYDRFGLLTKNALFAHGIHLNDRERERLSEAGAAIIHCPTSNNFLGSGIFQWQETATGRFPISIGLGTDIGGGTSYSMLATMRDAYVVSQLAGNRIDPTRLFYTATLGNAKLIGRADETGSLEAGKFADLAVLDPAATALMARRNEMSKTLVDVLFALIILGDDRAVSETYVSGAPLKSARR